MSAKTVQSDLSAYVKVKTTDKTPNILDLIVRLVSDEGPWRGTVRELRDCLGLEIPSQSLAVLLEQAQTELERRGVVIDRTRDIGQHVIAISYDAEAGAAVIAPPPSIEPRDADVSSAEPITPSVEYPVTFPFSWVINAKEISRIIEFSNDERENAKPGRKACSLCGSKVVAYEKLSSGFSNLICAECATRYVLNARALKRRVEWRADAR